MGHQCVGRTADDRKRQSGAFGDVQKTVAAVRQVEHPQQRQLASASIGLAADGLIQASPPELRLSLGALIDVRLVAVQHVEDGEGGGIDRKSTRLNSSHGYILYSVF